MASLKVLHVITGLDAGGAERALVNGLAGGLAAQFDSAVLALRGAGRYGDALRALGVPVHMLDMRRAIPGPTAVARLRRIVRSFDPDIIQGWMYHGNLAAWLGQRMVPGGPALVWNVRHSLYGLTGEKRMTRQVIRANRWFSGAPDALLYNSHLSRRQHEAFGFRSEKAQVIPNGFDLDSLGPDPETRQRVRSRLGIPGDVPVIGHVARFHPMKDHARFMRAAVRVALSHDDVHVLMVGRGVTRDNESLASLVPARVSARFHWLGERKDAQDLMRAMDVLCLSSAWGEAFPNVLGEAMATGVPCVATDIGDSAFILGETGHVVPAADDEALFNGLMAMLGKTPEQRLALGHSARARIEAMFGLDAVVALYAGVYENLANDRRNTKG